MLPDIVPVEAIDENVSAEVQEVYSGSSHRHIRSSVSNSKFSDEEAYRRRRINTGYGSSAADLWLRGGGGANKRRRRRREEGARQNEEMLENDESAFLAHRTPIRQHPNPVQQCTLTARASLVNVFY